MASYYRIFSVKDKNKEELNNYLKTTGVWARFIYDDQLVVYDEDKDNFDKVIETLINDFKLELINNFILEGKFQVFSI